MTDLSPFKHALLSTAFQIGVGLLTGNWLVGGFIGCTWWAAREHTQAEYRWIVAYGSGKRANMPWWGGFDPRAWDAASALDFLIPVIASILVYRIVSL